MDEDEAAISLMQLSGQEKTPEVVLKPKKTASGDLVVDLTATFQYSTPAETTADIDVVGVVEQPKIRIGSQDRQRNQS